MRFVYVRVPIIRNLKQAGCVRMIVIPGRGGIIQVYPGKAAKRVPGNGITGAKNEVNHD